LHDSCSLRSVGLGTKIKEAYPLSALTQVLFDRLEKKEIYPSTIPGFIRNLANTVLINPHMNHAQVNEQLHFLGWDDVELDYHTLQLAIACFEAEGLEDIEKNLARLTEATSKLCKSTAHGQLSSVITGQA
jgi:hypothetical protein